MTDRREWALHVRADGRSTWWTREPLWLGAIELGERAAIALGAWG